MKSIEAVIAKLDNLSSKLSEAGKAIPTTLAGIGEEQAEQGFASATYAGLDGDVEVSVESAGTEATLSATGYKVLFIEFGTGVGMGEGYPDVPGRPDGVVGIGEYGKHRGAHPPWIYLGGEGKNPPPGTHQAHNPDGSPAYSANGLPLIKTRGNPPAAAMAAAYNEILVQKDRVIKEALK